MILGTRFQIDNISMKKPSITVKGVDVERVSEARNLGLLMDEELRFESHILKVASNCFYRLKVLYQVRNSLNTDIRIKLCDSLVLSKFNYMDVLYGPRLLVRTQKVIQRVQNACIRFCFNVPPRSHVTPFMNTANILKMKGRRDLHMACLLFNLVKYKTPPYLADKLVWARDVLTCRTRSLQWCMLQPRPRIVSFRGSFRYAASKCWNDLPPPLRNLKSLTNFKVKYKLYLLNIQKNATSS